MERTIIDGRARLDCTTKEVADLWYAVEQAMRSAAEGSETRARLEALAADFSAEVATK